MRQNREGERPDRLPGPHRERARRQADDLQDRPRGGVFDPGARQSPPFNGPPDAALALISVLIFVEPQLVQNGRSYHAPPRTVNLRCLTLIKQNAGSLLRAKLTSFAILAPSLKSNHARPVQYRAHVRQDKGEEHGPNPPNGSWGIVKARPTPTKELSPNPPNGSWGIVKARPSPTAMSD